MMMKRIFFSFAFRVFFLRRVFSVKYNGIERESCPLYTKEESDECTECKEGEFLDKSQYISSEVNYKCKKNCPLNKITIENSYCLECPIGYYVYKNECLEKCPEYTEPKEEGYCQECKLMGKFFYEGKCQNNCDGLEKDEVNYSCYKCSDKTFLYQNKCVNSCPKNTIITKDKACVECNGFVKDNECNNELSECPEGYEKDEKSCINCKEKNMKYQEGKCVNDCSESYYDDKYICKKCESSKPILHSGECTDRCPNDLVMKNNICYCEENKYFYYGKCIDSCKGLGENIITKETAKQCVNCLKENKNFYNNTCFYTCPKGTGADENNVCRECSKEKGEYSFEGKCYKTEDLPAKNIGCEEDTRACFRCKEGEFSNDNKCVDECPLGKRKDRVNFQCVTCDGKFVDASGEKCVDKCEDENIIDNENKVCKSCDNYIFDKKCIKKCPIGTETENNGKKCKRKCNDNYFLEGNGCITESQCKEKNGYVIKESSSCILCNVLFYDRCLDERGYCPYYSISNYYPLDQNFACSLCSEEHKDSNEIFYHDGSCYAKCPKGSYADKTNFCLECPRGKYLLEYNGSHSCVKEEKCAQAFYISKTADKGMRYCQRCEDGEFYNQATKTCVTNCQEENYFVEENKEFKTRSCRSCKDEGKFNYNNYCYETCEEASKETGKILKPVEGKNICILDEKKEVEVYFIRYEEDTVIFGYVTALPSEDIKLATWSTDMGESLNGKNEMVLKISTLNLPSGVYTVSLTLQTQEKNKDRTSTLSFNYEVFSQDNFDVSATYDKTEPFYAMKSILKLVVSEKGESKEVRNYQFFFVDIYNDELALAESSASSTYESTIPKAKEIVIKITDGNGRECKKRFEVPMEVVIDKEQIKESEEIINSNDLTTSAKLLHLYNKLAFVQETSGALSSKETEAINKFSRDLLYQRNHIPIVLSVLNTVINTSKGENVFEIVQNVENVISSSITKISSESTNQIDNYDIRAYFRNIDNILTGVNQARRRLRVLSEEESSALKSVLINSQKSLGGLNLQMSKSLVPGETKSVAGVNFQALVASPSSMKDSFSIPHKRSHKYRRLDQRNGDIKSYSANSEPSSTFADPCNEKSENLFCMREKNIQKIKDKIALQSESSQKDSMSIGLLEIDNTAIYQESGVIPISASSVVSTIYSNGEELIKEAEQGEGGAEKEGKDLNEMKYIVSYDISTDTSFSSEFASNCACVSFSQLKKPKPSVKCKTFFDYKAGKTICKCSGTGEIVPVWDFALSSLAKLAQFPAIDSHTFNKFNTTFIISSLFIISLFSLVLLVLDYRDDKNYKKTNAIQEFTSVQDMAGASLMHLSWYATSYTYPFLGVVFLYNYGQPRFFRFLIQSFSLLVSIIFSSIPFYKSEFTYREVFINERDVETVDYDIHNLPSKIIDIVSSFLYSFAACIISNLIVLVFQLLLRYQEILTIFWTEKKKILREYVKMNYIYKRKKSHGESFKSYLKRFSLKCQALLMFGEEYLKRQKKLAELEFIFHKERKRGVSSIAITKMKSLPRNKFKSDTCLVDIHGFGNRGNFCLSPKSSSIKVENVVNSFSLNRYITDMEARKKIEKKYYIVKVGEKRKIINYNPAKTRHCKVYSHGSLKVNYGNSYTFFKREENALDKRTKAYEMCQIAMTGVSVLLLIGLYLVVYYYILVIFGDIYRRYEFYIIKSWFVPAMIHLFIFRLFYAYGRNLGYFIAIKFFYRNRKKNCMLRLVFRFFIPLFLVAMYKVRKIIDEYYRDFVEDINKREEDKLNRKT